MSCTLEAAIQSGDTGLRIPFWQLSIDHSVDVHKGVHYEVKHRLYMPWKTSQYVMPGHYKKTAHQSARSIVAI